ncbi:MAG: hypothetical protein Q9167_005464 [Letrouitia subvulpina]
MVQSATSAGSSNALCIPPTAILDRGCASSITNYSRSSTGQESDYLVREDDLEDELRCWEAAYSTSAAPTYFPPYYYEAKRQSYIDGALHRNNPIQILEEERRAIWQDETPPDILLSVGTGIQIEAEGVAKFLSKSEKTVMWLLPMGIRGKLAIGLDVIQSTLDCNRQWDEFVASTRWDRKISHVCHRLNIGLKDAPPHIDNFSTIASLKREAKWYLSKSRKTYLNENYTSEHRHIQVVARRLTAALFYFETVTADEDERCTGMLHCRLSSGMRDNFRRLLSEGPTFRVIQRKNDDNWSSQILNPRFDEVTFSGRIEYRVSSKRRVIKIKFPRWRDSWEAISGFAGLG